MVCVCVCVCVYIHACVYCARACVHVKNDNYFMATQHLTRGQQLVYYIKGLFIGQRQLCWHNNEYNRC